MSKKKKIIFIFLPLFITLSILVVKFRAQEDVCTEYTETIVEDFDTDLYKNAKMSSVAYWPPGPITLNWLGGNLDMKQPSGMGAKIYVAAPGDFDNDGYPDLIGFNLTTCTLVLIRNRFNDANLDGVDDDGLIFQLDPSETYDWGFDQLGPASITTGDYNRDGLIDFFFIKNSTDKAIYQNFSAVMYINCGTANNPHFNRASQAPNLDFTAKFKAAGIYLRWCADHLCSVDIDKDGDTDILDVSNNEIYLVRNPGSSNFGLNNFTIKELNYNQRPGFPLGVWIGGGSSINAADFDRDGDVDIIASSIEKTVPYIVFYENDGTGFFKRYELPIGDPNCIGTVALLAADFDQDGLIDIMGANDKAISGNTAKLYRWKNKGIVKGGSPPINFEWNCLLNCQPILPPLYDCDMGICCDIDKDGDLDVILADANNSGDYYLAINNLANVYDTFGEAQSLNLIPLLDSRQFAVTKVTISSLKMGTRGTSNAGLKVEFYLSNNGEDWELFATWEGADIHDYTNLPTYFFKHFGSQLLWKAVFSAPEDRMKDYTGASFDTPWIGEIEFKYVYTERKEYSRTSAAATFVDYHNVLRKCIIASTFYYPGWQGHLRAYDVSSMAAVDTSYSVLQTITQSNFASPTGRNILVEGVNIMWDAGQLLSLRPADDRKIYTAIPSETRLTRVDFTTSYVDTLGPIIKDVNNDNEGLINFVRGAGRSWKLGDSNHSTPVVVGPPQEEAFLMGTGYQEFKNYWKDRHKVIYLGANDGMLHCFDIVTGEELWAFIPYNLLPKLRDMCDIIPETGERTFNRVAYVDASPNVADVYIDTNGDAAKEWITILVCGQGPGYGSSLAGGLNYYFALDVTDPNIPKPLWEFTDNGVGESWSVPQIGKVIVKGSPAWAAFVGSGYNNNKSEILGKRFYAVDLETGMELWKFTDLGVNTIAKHKFTWDIDNAFAGSPSIVDLDQDGFTDLVYFADLDGRVWRADVSADFTGGEGLWPVTKIYEDSYNLPILTKPAVWLKANAFARIFFGTGGDDNAPNDIKYSFVALVDKATPEVEWYLGDPLMLNLPVSKRAGVLDVGEKVWADPVVANSVVYFSSLKGNIENVDPCENIIGVGKLYARYIDTIAGAILGGTALKTESGPIESLQLEIKTRAAVTLGERQTTRSGTRKRAVYIQEYNSTIQKLEQAVLSGLKIKSWREIFRIMK